MAREVFSAARLAAVRRSGLLDTDPEESFDRLARLAATLLDAPFAFVTVVDERRSFWKSCIGRAADELSERQWPVEQSFCQYVIGSGGPLVVRDARADARTAANPSIGLMGVAAWIGWPVLAPDGEVLGTFCVVDTVTRNWTRRDEQVIETLAHAASGEVALRAALGEAQSDAARELARFKAIAEQTSDLIWMADAGGRAFYVNPAGRRLTGLTADADLTGRTVRDFVTARAAPILLGEALPATAARGVWAGEMEFTDRDGVPIPMWQVIVAHHDDQGEVEFFSTVARDLRERQQAELASRQVAAEIAAREVSEAAAARLRAMVGGLTAIIWEADAVTQQFTFVSEQAEQLLGYPLLAWLADPGFWPSLIHPDDRAEVLGYVAAQTAAGRDHDVSYRVVTADGGLVWLHDRVHVVCDASGTPRQTQGVMIDITARKRAELAAELLAAAGRLLAEPGALSERLTALVELAGPALAAGAVVSLREPDGRYRPVAAACPGRPELARAILGFGPHRLPEPLVESYRAGRPFVVDETFGELLRAASRHQDDLRPRRVGGVHSSLQVPLILHGRQLGSLAFVESGPPRGYDAADLALAEELGRRTAIVLEAARVATRERLLREVTAGLAAAGTLAEAAQALAAGVAEAFDASMVSIRALGPDGWLRRVHACGVPQELIEAFPVMHPEDRSPLTDAVRTGEPVWLPNRSVWRARYPDLVPHLREDTEAAMALPMAVAGRVVGSVGVVFATPRAFDDDERTFALALVGQAAQAFDRAQTADHRRHIAETLQRALLSEPPEIDGVQLAVRYQPAGHTAQVGGDWHDVITLDGGLLGLVVGDCVGRGLEAAAVMGQLRSAVRALLLEVKPPGQVLTSLDQFAARIPGARCTTVFCALLDPVDGTLRYSSAGHLPAMLVKADGAVEHLDRAGSLPLATVPVGRRPEATVTLSAASTLLLYTDGLVERRGEDLDRGLLRLAAVLGENPGLPPDQLADTLMTRLLPPAGGHDDVALLIYRQAAPTHFAASLPAEVAELAPLRRTLRGWLGEIGVDEVTTCDVLLATDEAAANAVEHGCGLDPSGTVTVEAQRDEAGLEITINDTGRWRVPDGTPTARGRGLLLMENLMDEARIDPRPDGTTVRLRKEIGRRG